MLQVLSVGLMLGGYGIAMVVGITMFFCDGGQSSELVFTLLIKQLR